MPERKPYAKPEAKPVYKQTYSVRQAAIFIYGRAQIAAHVREIEAEISRGLSGAYPYAYQDNAGRWWIPRSDVIGKFLAVHDTQ